REFWFLLNNWVLLSGCLLVMVLTVFPNISEAFGEKITISIPAFNRWMTPVGLALLVITGIGPMLGWRSTDGAGLKRQFLWPLSAGLLTAGLLLAVFGRHRGLPAGTWALCVFVLATIVQEVIRASRIRAKAVGSSALAAVPGLIGRNRRRYGGYIIHLGIVLMCVGFAGDSFKVEREVVMRPGQRVDIGAYSLRFDGIESGADEAKQMLTATLSVYASGKHLGQIQPARWTFFKHEDQPTTEVALRRTLKEDLFVAIGDHDPQAGTTGFKAIINPLVNWVWIGFLVLALGTAIAALPIGAPVATAAGTTALLLLLLGWPALARADATHGVGGNNPAHDVPTDKPVILDSDSERSVMKNFACLCGGCPKIPLDSCPCGFAQTERAAIRGKIAQGWDLERIIGWYTTARGPEIGKKPFGAVALAIPPDTAFNRLSWLVPYGASAVAAGVLFALGRRWARRRRAADETQTPAEAAAASSSDKAYEELLKRELKDLE
ncbi:MAG: hypothetical protein IT371_29655, partial [Deltaproteobacteria bacterium]|nr:hypothetical protein [Deltaproteobacteria bacterium]